MTDKHQGWRRPLRAAQLLGVLAITCAPAAFGLQIHTAAHANTTPPNPDCTLIVPPNPLTAEGLATPFQLVATDPAGGPCNETNDAQSAFVEAGIFDPHKGVITVYHPLVIDKGTQPAVAPVVPELPQDAVVALWFGYNGNSLTLTAASARTLEQAHCVNGAPDSPFGQFSYCNASNFFRRANLAIWEGRLRVPPVGTANDGKPCPTVRDFMVVDQDQSDNLPTLYLVTPDGELAQYSARNLAALKGAVTLGNPSDNRLLDVFIDGALRCKPFMAQDLGDPGQWVPALPLNELQARMHQITPVALIPGGDPMTVVDGNEDLHKVNRYRRGVDQPLADSYHDVDTARYCRQMIRIAPGRILANKTRFTKFYSPDTGAAKSLYTFLAQRFVQSYGLLNCETLTGIANPISVTTNADGVVTKALIDTAALDKAIRGIASTRSSDDFEDAWWRSLWSRN